jgi:hypothetical protein
VYHDSTAGRIDAFHLIIVVEVSNAEFREKFSRDLQETGPTQMFI